MKRLLTLLLLIPAPLFAGLGRHAPAPLTAAAQPKLPLIEVPSTKGTSDTMVVFVSGDGGWASIDKSISRSLADNGMPVVGLNALQYFWTKRTPETAARDLQTIIDTYLGRWKRSRVVVVGYSRGADVLPVIVNRLPHDVQQKIRLVALLGPSPRVELEFHVADWFHDPARGMAVRPEVERMTGLRILCLWGEDDKDSVCPGLSGPTIRLVMLKGAHHFDGHYERLAQIILDQLK